MLSVLRLSPPPPPRLPLASTMYIIFFNVCPLKTTEITWFWKCNIQCISLLPCQDLNISNSTILSVLTGVIVLGITTSGKLHLRRKKNPTGSKVYGLVAGEWKVSSAKFSIGSGTTKPQVENVFGECYIWSYNGSHIITKWLVLLGCSWAFWVFFPDFIVISSFPSLKSSQTVYPNIKNVSTCLIRHYIRHYNLYTAVILFLFSQLIRYIMEGSAAWTAAKLWFHLLDSICKFW